MSLFKIFKISSHTILLVASSSLVVPLVPVRRVLSLNFVGPPLLCFHPYVYFGKRNRDRCRIYPLFFNICVGFGFPFIIILLQVFLFRQCCKTDPSIQVSNYTSLLETDHRVVSYRCCVCFAFPIRMLGTFLTRTLMYVSIIQCYSSCCGCRVHIFNLI